MVAVSILDVGVVTLITDVTKFSTIDVFFVVEFINAGGFTSGASSILSSGSCLMSSTLTRGHVLTVDDGWAGLASFCAPISVLSSFISFLSILSISEEDVDDTRAVSSVCFDLALAEACAAAEARWFKLAAT